MLCCVRLPSPAPAPVRSKHPPCAHSVDAAAMRLVQYLSVVSAPRTEWTPSASPASLDGVCINCTIRHHLRHLHASPASAGCGKLPCLTPSSTPSTAASTLIKDPNRSDWGIACPNRSKHRTHPPRYRARRSCTADGASPWAVSCTRVVHRPVVSSIPRHPAQAPRSATAP